MASIQQIRTAEELLAAGFRKLSGVAKDGSQVYKKCIAESSRGTQNVYAKVGTNNRVNQYVDWNVYNHTQPNSHQTITSFLTPQGERTKMYTSMSTKKNANQTRDIFQIGKDTPQNNSYMEIVYGEDGQIFGAKKLTDYGSGYHTVKNRIHHDRVYSSRWFTDRPYNTAASNGYQGEYALNEPSRNFVSWANAEKNGWFNWLGN